MRRSHPNSIHRFGRRRRLPDWWPNAFWILTFLGLSTAVLALTAYQG
jgi:hypothetical protein